MANIETKTPKKIFGKNWQTMQDSPLAISCSYLDEYCQNIDAAPILREAKATYRFWAEKLEVFVFAEDKICGFSKSNEVAGFNYGGGTWINHEKAQEYIRQEKLTDSEEQAFMDKLQLMESHRYIPCRSEDYTEEELSSIHANAATSTWFGGHMIPDYETILKLGLLGYEKKIEEYRKANGEQKKDFYDALDITLLAIEAVIDKFADKALKCQKIQMHEDLAHIAKNPPVSFRQALLLVWIVHMLNGSDSFGRFDFYLKGFFEADIAAGRMDLEEAYGLIVDFWCKIEGAQAIQNMTLGGVDYAGVPIYSELTRLCIEATAKLGFKGPNLCLRVRADMPGYIWETALDSIKTGNGLPALYNDELFTNSLQNFGYDLKYARGYCFAGCSQLMIPGVCNFVNDIGMMNAAKIAEIALYDGYDPHTKKQVSIKTGAPEDIESFEGVLAAYKKQLDYFCKIETDIHEKEYRYRASREGYAMRTLFTGDCIEKGKGVYEGGARFSNIELEVIGITNAADHLYAIKNLVFDKKIVSLPALAQILKNNWRGHEALRALAIQCDKFGNDKPEVDAIRADITEHIYESYNNKKSALGGIYIPGEVIFTAHDWCGAATGATADGRLAKSVLADSAGAQQGLDKNGPTALL
ncbi:MAG: pyruvate formate lyase family protein, partial [Oscillospiraceae bacterium]|nr:pyruvate formate lyase family protein [Oscillospiraceae bacterium]